MPTAWKQTSTVGEGGRIEVVVPELQPGDIVEVQVARTMSPSSETGAPVKREMGFLRGEIWIADGFDAPLEDFAEYM